MAASIADGMLFSLMVGLGESYLAAFVLAIGLGQVAAGLTSTLPMVLGAVLQLACARLLRQLASLKRWVVLWAGIQALAFVPLTIVAWRGQAPLAVVFGAAALYWGAGLATGPAWNTWMGRLIPESIRARFFARRIGLTHAAVLAGLLVAGGVLHWAEAADQALTGFAAIFCAAGICRLLSVTCLALHTEPPLPPGNADDDARNAAGPGRLPANARDGRRLLRYMLAVQVATQVAAPFFTPYMLGQLALPYGSYVSLLATSYVSKALTLPAAGRFAHRFGARASLWMAGVGIVPTAALWSVSPAFPFLFLLQIFSGFIWGCYELSTFLLLLETIPDDRRTAVLTRHNLLHAASVALGSLIGAALFWQIGGGAVAYSTLFLSSALLRMLTLLMLRKVSDAPRVPVWVGLRTLAVRPSAGSIERPILPTVPPAPAQEASPE
jgi:hypothetical protein